MEKTAKSNLKTLSTHKALKLLDALKCHNTLHRIRSEGLSDAFLSFMITTNLPPS